MKVLSDRLIYFLGLMMICNIISLIYLKNGLMKSVWLVHTYCHYCKVIDLL